MEVRGPKLSARARERWMAPPCMARSCTARRQRPSSVMHKRQTSVDNFRPPYPYKAFRCLQGLPRSPKAPKGQRRSRRPRAKGVQGLPRTSLNVEGRRRTSKDAEGRRRASQWLQRATNGGEDPCGGMASPYADHMLNPELVCERRSPQDGNRSQAKDQEGTIPVVCGKEGERSNCHEGKSR